MATADIVHAEERDNESALQEKGLTDLDTVFTPAQQKSIKRRVDMRLCIPLGAMYAISLVDKTNLSSANIAGMSADLGLGIGTRYSVIALVFFTTYVVFQFPGTILTIKFGAHNVLPGLTVIWGFILIGMGFANQWYDLVIYRMILGMVESVVLPGAFFLLSAWYVRYEVHKRYSFFYIVANVGSALAGLLAYGLMQMKGLQGLNGWRWIFIIEGVVCVPSSFIFLTLKLTLLCQITCVAGIVARVFIVGLPQNAGLAWKFLAENETQWMLDRVERDRADSELEPFSLKLYLSSLTDYKLWAFGLLSYCATTVAYAIAYFLPIILQGGLGFSIGLSQLLICPPYLFAAFVTYGTAWVGDKLHLRGPIIVFNNLLMIVGMLLLALVKESGVRYFGIFLATGGVTASVPAIYAYQSNNIRGQWKRGASTALMILGGGLGGISGSLVFRTIDYPVYTLGIYFCVGSAAVSILIVAAMTVEFMASNRKARNGDKLIEKLEGFYYTL